MPKNSEKKDKKFLKKPLTRVFCNDIMIRPLGKSEEKAHKAAEH